MDRRLYTVVVMHDAMRRKVWKAGQIGYLSGRPRASAAHFQEAGRELSERHEKTRPKPERNPLFVPCGPPRPLDPIIYDENE